MYIYWSKGGARPHILWLFIGVGVAGVSILWRARVRLRREDGNPGGFASPRTLICL